MLAERPETKKAIKTGMGVVSDDSFKDLRRKIVKAGWRHRRSRRGR